MELLGATRAQTSGLARCHGAAGELQNGSADASGSHQRPQADVSNPTRQRAFELSFWRGVRNAALRAVRFILSSVEALMAEGKPAAECTRSTGCPRSILGARERLFRQRFSRREPRRQPPCIHPEELLLCSAVSTNAHIVGNTEHLYPSAHLQAGGVSFRHRKLYHCRLGRIIVICCVHRLLH